jgi:pimeloyl-ACP methyl ester carboxylesterase
MQMATMALGDRSLYCEMRGEGEPLMLIAGLGSDCGSWEAVAGELARHFRVIALDNRGCGRSSTPEEEYSIRDLADDAAGLLEALGVPRAHVLGHSMGGFIAQEMAIRHPERVSRLILAGTSLRSSRRNNEMFEDFARRLRTEDYSDWLRSWVPWLFSRECRDRPSFTENFVAAGAAYPYRQTADGFAGQVGALRGFDARGRAGEIMSKTLVLEGELDVLITPEEAIALAGEIPGCRSRLLQGVGHSLHVEAPERFADTVLTFLRK